MPGTYHFVSRWRVRATVPEVLDIIGQPLEYPRWWPSVYLSAREITWAGSPARRVQFHTRGLLPYTLIWDAAAVERTPEKVVIEASGDLEGRGVWSFSQDGDYVDITFEWDVDVNKTLVRYMTPVLRPVFEANHRWSMEQGESSLREELIRYRARTPGEMLDAADPRGPVEVPVRMIAMGALALSAIAGFLLLRRRARTSQAAS
ncbi:MAG TPA: hypothetical protein VGM43_16930 [Bryobacteraceae bacterium]|jgi:hypothetical protein